MLYGDGYSLCGERTVYLEDKNYPSVKIQATGFSYNVAPYVTVTAFDTDADFTERYYTVTFTSTSEFDYGLHEFYFK